MNDATIIELAKQSEMVSTTYTIESGNISWPRLKGFAKLVEAQIVGESEATSTELLEALEALCARLPCKTKSPNAYDCYHARDELDAARSVIAKATGGAA